MSDSKNTPHSESQKNDPKILKIRDIPIHRDSLNIYTFGDPLMSYLNSVIRESFTCLILMQLRKRSIYPLCTQDARMALDNLLKNEFERQVTVQIQEARRKAWNSYPKCVRDAHDAPPSDASGIRSVGINQLISILKEFYGLRECLESLYVNRGVLMLNAIKQYIESTRTCMRIFSDKIVQIWDLKIQDLIRKVDSVRTVCTSKYGQPDGSEEIIDSNQSPSYQFTREQALDIVQRGGLSSITKETRFHTCLKHLVDEFKIHNPSIDATRYLQLVNSCEQYATKNGASLRELPGKFKIVYEECLRNLIQEWNVIQSTILFAAHKQSKKIADECKEIDSLFSTASVTPKKIREFVYALSNAISTYFTIQCLEKIKVQP